MIDDSSWEDLIARVQWNRERCISGYRTCKGWSIFFFAVAAISSAVPFMIGWETLGGILFGFAPIAALAFGVGSLEYKRGLDAVVHRVMRLEEKRADEVLRLEMPELYFGGQ